MNGNGRWARLKMMHLAVYTLPQFSLPDCFHGQCVSSPSVCRFKELQLAQLGLVQLSALSPAAPALSCHPEHITNAGLHWPCLKQIYCAVVIWDINGNAILDIKPRGSKVVIQHRITQITIRMCTRSWIMVAYEVVLVSLGFLWLLWFLPISQIHAGESVGYFKFLCVYVWTLSWASLGL